MRRALLIPTLVLVAGGIVLLVSHGGRRYRVAVIFDSARGTVPGQRVKIAGAVVGSVDAVRITHVDGQLKAKMILRVDRRFGPFHADARCSLLPEGILSENFVECDPGTSTQPVLAPAVGALPTVTLNHTTAPFSLQDMLNVFSLPTDEHLRVLLDELGIATSGRGADLNALLLRADPALAQTRRAVAILNAQRDQIVTATSQTHRVLAALAARSSDVRAFVDRVANVSQTSAQHSEAVHASIQRLPALLDAARPGLHALDTAMAAAPPLLHSLRRSGAGLERLTSELPQFASTGQPALRSLAGLSQTGIGAVRSALPAISDLATAARRSGPFASDMATMFTSMRDKGGIEGMLRFFYSMAVSQGAYDATSHMFGLLITVLPQCLQDPSTAGCASGYTAPGAGTIPANDPACGPQGGAPWDPPTSCAAQPAPRRHVGASHLRIPLPPHAAAPPVGTQKAPPPHVSIPQAPDVSVPQGPQVSVPQVPHVSVPHVPDLSLPLGPHVAAPQLPTASRLKALLDYLLGP